MRRALTVLSLIGLSVAAAADITPIIASWYFPTVNVAPTDSYGQALAVASASPSYVVVSDGTSDPVLAVPGANASKVGIHGIYGSADTTNLAYRSLICETQDGSNEPQGWASVETAGDGSADISCSTDYAAVESYSAKVVLTGTTSYASVRTACITTGIGSDLYVSAYQMCASGTCTSQLRILEYDAADCSSYLADTLIAGTVGTTTWAKFGDKFASGTWNGSTSSYKIHLFDSGDSGTTTYWSVPMVRVADQPIDNACLSDADAAAVCNVSDMTFGYQKLTPADWKFEAIIRSPIDGAVATPVRYIFAVPATAGDNNKISLSWASDLLTLDVYDSAGVQVTSTVAAAGNANTSYAVKAYHRSNGDIVVCFDGTCDATPGTAALTNGVGSDPILGSDGTNGGNVWLDDVRTSRRIGS